MNKDLTLNLIKKPEIFLDTYGQSFVFYLQLICNSSEIKFVDSQAVLRIGVENFTNTFTMPVYSMGNFKLLNFKINFQLMHNSERLISILDLYQFKIYDQAKKNNINTRFEFMNYLDRLASQFEDEIRNSLLMPREGNLILDINYQKNYKNHHSLHKVEFNLTNYPNKFFEIRNLFGKIAIDILASPDDTISSMVGKNRIQIY
jgi:hypothetical protein